MPLFRDLPIKRKLTVTYLTGCCVVLGLFASLLLVFQWADIRTEVEAKVVTVANVVADHAARSLADRDDAAIQELMESLRADPMILAACFVNDTERVVAGYGESEEQLRLRNLSGKMSEAGTVYLSQPILWQGRAVGRLNLKADYWNPMKNLVVDLLAAFGAAFAVSVGCVLLVLRPTRHLLIEPLEELADTATRISDECDYRLRAPVRGNDEVGQLARAFNGMVSQIQSRDQALREKELRFRRLFQVSSMPMWMVTLGDWEVVAVNEAIEKLYGYSAEEFREIGPGLLASTLDPLIAQLQDLDQHPIPTMECHHQHKDGSPLIVEVTLRAHDVAGDPAMLVQVLDLTGQRQAVAALKDSEERFRAVVENLTDGLLLHDGTGRVIYSNPRMAVLVGCTAAELSELSAFELLRPPQETALAFEDQCYESEVRRKDGSTASVRVRTSPLLKPTGEIIATVAVVTDLTACKAAEAEVAASQARLIEVSRMAGMAEVATGVLHNVGNVLNSVNVSATVIGDRLRQSRISGLQRTVRLLEQHAGDLGNFFANDPKGRLVPDYLGKLYWQLDSERNELVGELAGLTKNLDHIKEIVAMQQSYARVDGLAETVSPAVLLEDALRLNEEALVRNRVSVERDYDSSAPKVVVDKHKVLEILVNLITNARHAVTSVERPDRRIRVRVARPCARRVCVEVQDNGVGIASEHLVRIFQHGFTTKKDGHGFGLHSGALAARQMGGKLSVTSEGPGLGATFRLELPGEDASAAGQGNASPSRLKPQTATA